LTKTEVSRRGHHHANSYGSRLDRACRARCLAGRGLNAVAPIDRANRELARLGLGMSTVFGARHHERFPDGLPWTCTLRYARRRMTIAYYAHPHFEQEPTVAEVLSSLLQDSRDYEQVQDFVEFCDTFNYQRDRRRSEWTYAACGDAVAGLRHLLGDDYTRMAVTVADIW
jgi:hypothetical protein